MSLIIYGMFAFVCCTGVCENGKIRLKYRIPAKGGMTLEEWTALYEDLIPYSENYIMKLEAGEENGLCLYLEDDFVSVTLDFGVVYSVSVLDEGLLLNDSFWNLDDNGIIKTGKGVLYSVENGKYADSVKQSLGEELFEHYGLRQYNVITMNYVVYVLAKEEPELCLQKKSKELSPLSADNPMAEIFALLEDVKNNYSMYIGRKSLRELAALISSYELAMNRLMGHSCSFSVQFQRYVEAERAWNDPMIHWSKILQSQRTDSEAFDLFYELLEEFKKT